MKKYICLILALMLCLFSVMALADEDAVTIKVSGSGSISSEPDLMRVSATVSTMDRELSIARESVNTTINEIHDTLTALGISESDVITSGYSCTTIYDYSQTPYTLTGYQTSHTLTVTCHDPALVDAVLEALVANGMTEIYGIDFDVSNRKELYLNALALAVDAAKEKAAVLVGAANLENYAISEITEEQTYGYSNYMTKETASEDRAGGTGIHTGDVTIDASITVTFTAK